MSEQERERATLKEIVVAYLRANGFGGLYNDDECGCSLADFMPCDGPSETCTAGYSSRCRCGCVTVGSWRGGLCSECAESGE